MGSVLRSVGLTIVLAGSAPAQVTRLLEPALLFGHPSITPDGRFVVWSSEETTSPYGEQVYFRELPSGAPERISLAMNGGETDGASSSPSISADGRFVAFESRATNLVPGDANGTWDVFVRDRRAGTTERASVSSLGDEADDQSYGPKISGDGRWIVFTSIARNLVPSDTNYSSDAFIHDRVTGVTERISLSSNGTQGNSDSFAPAITPDGRFIAFASAAANLVPGDLSPAVDLFLRSRESATTELITSGLVAEHHWGVYSKPSISADGRFVAFGWSPCNSCGSDIYLFDRGLGSLQLVDVNPRGSAEGGYSYNPSISPDGRFICFDSFDPTLVPDDTNVDFDVFLRDHIRGTTERVSVSSQGAQGNQHSGGWMFASGDRLSEDGRFVAFASDATNLAPGLSRHGAIYLRDRAHPEPPSLCEPGVAGVIACPCANAPAGPDRGCDNAAATGGASLSIGGGEYLSSDSLYFTVTGAKPNATSVVLQGSRPRSNGAVFGQGVRCVGGIERALYVRRISSDGTLVVPESWPGSPLVHARSAALGDPILPMSTRWYQLVYRDPIVLGGCPATATFNATQAREVLWLP